MKQFLKKFVGPALLLLLSLLFTEGILHLIPSPIQSAPLHEFGDPASLLGVELVAGASTTVHGGCYSAHVSVNDLGWRDRERSIERVPGKIRIAILGDSFVEGTQVNDDQTLTRQLEKMLGEDQVEVLNFGLSSIGTVQEEILYERVVAAYKPDIVLLGFYANDVKNSMSELEPNLTFRDEQGNLFSTRTAGTFFGLRKWLRIHSATFRLLKFADQQLRSLVFNDQSFDVSRAAVPKHLEVYMETNAQELEQGWENVRSSLRRLKSQMKPGQILIAFAFPDILQVEPDPHALVEKDFGIELPESFDARLPYDRFYSIAHSEHILTVETLDPLFAVRDQRQLQYPYFSHTCDGHYSAFGLETLAAILRDSLLPFIQNDS